MCKRRLIISSTQIKTDEHDATHQCHCSHLRIVGPEPFAQHRSRLTVLCQREPMVTVPYIHGSWGQPCDFRIFVNRAQCDDCMIYCRLCLTHPEHDLLPDFGIKPAHHHGYRVGLENIKTPSFVRAGTRKIQEYSHRRPQPGDVIVPSSANANRQARQVVSIAVAPGGGAPFTCARCLIALDPSDSVIIQGSMSELLHSVGG